MEMPALKQFSLVGGTALALKYGHRISVDLDLFSHLPFDNNEIITALGSGFGDSFSLQLNRGKFGVFCYINAIKVDIIKHPFILLKDLELQEGIRIYHTADIAAMKVNAILGSGKKKDFWDIFELLHHYSLTDIIQFYFDKFSNQQLMIGIPHALTYFDDAEESEDPISLKGQSWESVKKFIQQKVSAFLK
jgi:predicted nucleotidyltransferase component of viral defense system